MGCTQLYRGHSRGFSADGSTPGYHVIFGNGRVITAAWDQVRRLAEEMQLTPAPCISSMLQ
jgi:hypothetical protein